MTTRARLARKRHESGHSLVEFAVVSIAFFTFIFGITEGGRMIYDYNVVSTAARDGARWASVRGDNSGANEATTSQIQAYVVGRAMGRIATSNVTVAYYDDDCTSAVVVTPENEAGNCVSITVQRTFYTALSNLLPWNGVPLSSTTSMIIVR